MRRPINKTVWKQNTLEASVSQQVWQQNTLDGSASQQVWQQNKKLGRSVSQEVWQREDKSGERKTLQSVTAMTEVSGNKGVGVWVLRASARAAGHSTNEASRRHEVGHCGQSL